MQQEATKKSKKLIWLIAGLAALLVVAGVILTMFLLPGTKAPAETGPVGGRPDLYWNVDRQQFISSVAGMSDREPGDDGLYHIRFAYNGELVEYTVADMRLVNAIDSMDVVGLILDDNGNVIDAVEPTTLATEVARDAFVQKITDSMLKVNSSVAMNGMETTVDLCELTQMYDVTPEAKTPGAIAQPEIMDRVWVYANDKGEVTHVFIVATQPDSDVYWRVDPRNVDSNGNTKREPDENGVYTILFAVNGQQVELKCKDKTVVSEIDGKKNRLCDMGLLFDEEGYITEVMEAAVALRGKMPGAGYHITAIEGDQYTATYLLTGNNAGKTFSFTMNENCPVYNVCPGGTATYVGEPTEIKLNDRVIVYTDLEGNPVLVYVTYRMFENAEICYNITRMYSSDATTRKVDANGYYVFKVSMYGEHRTIRTKNKELASKLDSFSHKIVGVVLDGDIITAVCDPIYVVGHETYKASSTCMLYDQIGTIISFATTGSDKDGAMKNLVMAPDVEIYDVSGRPGTKVGQKTTLQVGDLIRVLADYQDNVTHVYVEASYSGAPIYYNLDRQYDSANDCTKRELDEEGYYVFNMASGGKEATVKTKSKEVASYIDRQSTKMVALDVSGGVIRNAYPYMSAYKYGYARATAAYYERHIGTKQITVLSSNKTSTSNIKISKNVKIYNVSGVYDDHVGEETTLRQGDRIYGVATADNTELVEIYVYTRKVNSKIYVNQQRMYSTAKGETTRQPRESDGYYVFDLLVDGEVKKFKTKSKDIATKVDANSRAFGLKLDGNVILAVYPITGVNGVNAESIVNYDIMSISGRNVSVEYKWPGSSTVGKTGAVKLASDVKIYDVSSYAKTFGQKTTLSEGDRVYALKNDANEITHIFVKYKNTREAGHIGYCEHCDQEVYWHPYLKTTYDDVHHAYLTSDMTVADALQINKADTPVDERQELVLDLNGKTLTASTRAFWVYGKLSIMDSSKAQTGKIVGSTSGKLQAIALSDGGVVNLYSGTLTREKDVDPVAKGGGVVKVTKNTTFNMYGGTIKGGMSDMGHNIYVKDATLNIQGGVVEGDVTVEGSKSVVKVGGTAKINKGIDGGLQLPSGILLSLKDVTKDTKICIDSVGVFTETVENADQYLTNKNFYSSDELIPVSNFNGALAVGKLMACPHCDGEEVLFGKFSPSACSGNAHLIVLEDMELDTQLVIGSSSDNTADVVIDLNGKKITLVKEGASSGHKTGRFALIYANLSIMDSSAEKTGTVESTVENISNNGGMIQMMANTTLNIYGGNLIASENLNATRGAVIYAGGHVIMHDGLISGGNTKADGVGGNVEVRPTGSFTMKGGKLTGGEAAQGGNIYANAGATVRLEGGVIENGTAVTGGGNIYCNDANMIIDENMVITGGAVGEAGLGGSIYVANGSGLIVKGKVSLAEEATTGGDIYIDGTESQITVTGAAQIDKITIPEGQMIVADGLTEGAKIKVVASGLFTNELESETVAADYITKEYFESLTETPVTQDVKALRCGEGSADDVTPPAESYVRECSHCGQSVEFTPLSAVTNKNNVFNTAGQTYHVIFTEEETTLTNQFCVGGTSADNANRDVTVVLDFNGKTVMGTGLRLATVFGKLYIQDTSAEKDGKFIGGASNTGGMIYVTNASSSAAKSSVENKTPELINEAVAYVKDIDMESTVTSSTSNGGGIAVSYGALYMENVKILNGKAGAGGSIYGLWSNVELTNCELLNGTATNGGNINVAACYLTVNGGKIGGGTASTAGDNIYARHNNSVVTLTNVVFDNGTATDKVDLHIKNIPSVTVSGSLQMKVNMELAGEESGLLTLGELTDNTLITFTADRDGVVTVPSEKAQEYFTAGYFAAGNGKTITVNTSNEFVIG